jgi:hypothetical protein
MNKKNKKLKLVQRNLNIFYNNNYFIWIDKQYNIIYIRFLKALKETPLINPKSVSLIKRSKEISKKIKIKQKERKV